MNYVFNNLLIKYLNRILNVDETDICLAYGGQIATYSYRIYHDTFPLADLVSICNAYHIPISWFIVQKERLITDTLQLPCKEDLVHKGKWIPIDNQFKKFGIFFSLHLGCNHEDSAKKCGVSPSNYYNLFINDKERYKSIKMHNFLSIMNNAKVYPGEFVIDKNRPIIKLEGYKEIGFRNDEKNDSLVKEHYHKQSIRQNNALLNELKLMKMRILELEEKLNEKNTNYVSMAAED